MAAKPPDDPLNLANVPEITNAYQVGLTWQEGAYNGGSTVIDYQVSYSADPFETSSVFASDITTTSATVTGLSPGVTYRFFVQARNVVNLS